MKRYAWVLFFYLLVFPSQVQALSETAKEVITLNNEGVKALNRKDWQIAVDDFNAALKLEPDYRLAKDNLVIAYRMHGLDLREQNKLPEALAEFHQAAFLADWPDVRLYIDQTIEKLGKKPNGFVDRLELADRASANGDYVGAIVEYRVALKLKNDAQARKRMADAYDKIGDKDKAAVEYETARKLEQEEKGSLPEEAGLTDQETDVAS